MGKDLGVDFSLEVDLVLTRAFCSLAQTRSLARLDWVSFCFKLKLKLGKDSDGQLELEKERT